MNRTIERKQPRDDLPLTEMVADERSVSDQPFTPPLFILVALLLFGLGLLSEALHYR